MTTIREKIKKRKVTFNAMIFLILLLCFLFYQNWKTHQRKLQDYIPADFTTIKGTLEKKPKYIHNRHHQAFYLDLLEYPKTTFCNSGIYLIPLEIEKIINNSNIGDSTIISILTQDLNIDGLNGQNLTIMELKVNGKEYLTLESLNSMLAEERPDQFGWFVCVIIIISIVIFGQALMVFGRQ